MYYDCIPPFLLSSAHTFPTSICFSSLISIPIHIYTQNLENMYLLFFLSLKTKYPNQ